MATVLFFLYSGVALSQTTQLDKKMQAVHDLVEKDKLDDASKELEQLLDENPTYGAGWDYLVKIRTEQYKNSQVSEKVLGNISVSTTTKDKDGNDVPMDNDSIAQNLKAFLSTFKPSIKAYNKYVYTLRLATLHARDAYYSSMYLRSIFVDQAVDTAVSKEALGYFQDAEEAFSKKDFTTAIKLYQRSIEAQPDFYKARLYIGDSYYAMQNYVEASKYFKEAIATQPNQLEPRKFLVDAYSHESLYADATREAIEALLVYPDCDLMLKLDDAAYLDNKKVAIQWTPRTIFPNTNKEPAETDINSYIPDSTKMIPKEPWTFYREAGDKIKPFCNDKGIVIESNSLTDTKYMEIYSWEYMLAHSQDASLQEAHKMQNAGFLDCYVMVTCFHFDFYDQYKDFASKNKERIREYFNRFIQPR